jgi:Opioid growth factor receptor (OGFr) conserved region
MNSNQQLTARLIPFYLGEAPDREGRMIEEIWAWDFEDLECVHNYIQWLFPIAEKSAFNLDAPVVDETVIQAFHSDSRLWENLVRSLTTMLHFYGLQRHETPAGKTVVEKSEEYGDRKQDWICRFDHNYLRITRILKCLMIFGLQDEAKAFYECLRQLYQEERDQIGSETFQYWTNAVNPVLE